MCMRAMAVREVVLTEDLAAVVDIKKFQQMQPDPVTTSATVAVPTEESSLHTSFALPQISTSKTEMATLIKTIPKNLGAKAAALY